MKDFSAATAVCFALSSVDIVEWDVDGRGWPSRVVFMVKLILVAGYANLGKERPDD